MVLPSFISLEKSSGRSKLASFDFVLQERGVILTRDAPEGVWLHAWMLDHSSGSGQNSRQHLPNLQS